MYKPNPQRINRIRALRAQGFTIDKIAAITGYPRSSVGYYARKYCGGKRRAQVVSSALPSAQHRPSEVPFTLEPKSKQDSVESYMRRIDEKEHLTLSETLEGKSKGDRATEAILQDSFERDPQTLHLRLSVIEDLIRLAPLLRIDIDRMRDTLRVLLTADR